MGCELDLAIRLFHCRDPRQLEPNFDVPPGCSIGNTVVQIAGIPHFMSDGGQGLGPGRKLSRKSVFPMICDVPRKATVSLEGTIR